VRRRDALRADIESRLAWDHLTARERQAGAAANRQTGRPEAVARRIGSYETLDLIGVGGMGEV
jgi:hypothetical protein